MKNKYYFAIIGSLVITSSLYAEENLNSFMNLSLEELMQVKVFIASGEEQLLSQASSVVSVITADDIRKTGATNLTDILSSVPGIHINFNSFANRPLIHMRGSNSFQTLLMVNGTPMRDLIWAFGIFWKGLPVSVIERVEIIRGPGSAVYGADASAGVINVITKTAGKIENSEIGIRLGSYNSQTAWMQTGGSWNGFDLGMTADLFKTDGHAPLILADKQSFNNTGYSTAPDNAHYGWNNADLRFSIKKNNWTMLANYMRHDNLETGLTGAGNFDPITSANDDRFDLDLLYKNNQFAKHWGIDAKFHFQDLSYRSNNGFLESPPSSDYPDGIINHISSAERQLAIEATSLYSGINKHSIRIGLGYQWKDLYSIKQQINQGIGPDGNQLPIGSPVVDISDTPYAFSPEKNQNIQFLFVQDVWDLSKDWQLTLGMRYDNYSDFGGTLNPRMALVWQTTQKLTSKILYGQGFRAPSFQELYTDTSRTLSNVSLSPEQSETTELAFSYAANKSILLALNIYHLKYSDFISPVAVVGQVIPQFQNTGKHKILGTEIEAQWHASNQLELSANYTFINPDDNQYRVYKEPEQQAYLRIDWEFSPTWNWNIQTNWVADRTRKDGDSRTAIDDYILLDTTLRYMGVKHWEFVASIRNVFDEDAREATGESITHDLPLPDRNFYAEINYKF
ncbi:MAG: TonB-dependent receptor [Pseudomonadota bacterium]